MFRLETFDKVGDVASAASCDDVMTAGVASWKAGFQVMDGPKDTATAIAATRLGPARTLPTTQELSAGSVTTTTIGSRNASNFHV